MKHSLKRLAIGGALAGAAFAAAPALASASSTCTFDTAGHQVVIQDGSGSGQLILSKSGRYITYADDFGPAQLCVKGTTIASVTNTDSVYVHGPLVGASDGYFVDESAGTFTPGFTHEDKGASDIELDFNPTGSAVKPAFTVRGTDQADHIITGENGKIDLNGDFDADVTLDGASFASAASRVVVF